MLLCLCEAEKLTGSATDRDVASRAAMRVMMQRLRKAAMNRHPGWNFSAGGDDNASDDESWRSVFWGTSSFGSSAGDWDDGGAMRLMLQKALGYRMGGLITVLLVVVYWWDFLEYEAEPKGE
jgi:hypothetical protein